MTPKEFADDIGVSQSFLVRLEEGSIDPELRIVERCANAFGLETSEFLMAVAADADPVVLTEETH